MVHKYALLPNEKKGYASTLGRYVLSGVGEFPLLDSVVCIHSVEAEVVKIAYIAEL